MPTPRHTIKFERGYSRRTAVERINGLFDELFGIKRMKVRGLASARAERADWTDWVVRERRRQASGLSKGTKREALSESAGGVNSEEGMGGTKRPFESALLPSG